MRHAPITHFSTAGANGRFFAKLNEMIDAINEARSISSPNTLTSITTLGTTHKSRAIAGAAGTDGMIVKGEWSSETTYGANEAVVIRGGTTAGFYISLIDSNEDLPYDSVNWLQLAVNNAIGNWT